MVIVGAKGHATEILDVWNEVNRAHELYFFDNISKLNSITFYNYPILSSVKQVKKIFEIDNGFILGLGGTSRRKDLAQQFIELGGVLKPIVSKFTFISNNCSMGNGVNIMPFASVYGNGQIGEGVLLNSYASVHHDARIGSYSEISPGARILGFCKIGNNCSIGANAVVLPGITICDNVIIGAGTIVTKNIEDPGTYIGVPAKKMK
jgi:sugar O-acyltransferase (sialic acid O-acetyltransferase NeuD family)